MADNQKEKKTNKAGGFGVIIDNEAKGMAFMKVYKSTLSQAKNGPLRSFSFVP